MSKFLFEKNRFRDNGETIYEFSNEFLVECPKCALMARVVLADNYSVKKIRTFASRRLVCLHCGHVEACDGKKATIGNARDWYFQRPFWLQTDCCGKLLWAYNEQHLDLLESYISAKLRERKPMVNKSVASHLPNWMIIAKNRDEILKALKKLKEKLPDVK